MIIPTLNEEKTLGKCLRSIDAQNYRDYEVIIVDGDSSDKTLEIAESYGHKILKFSRRRLHDVGSARNFGANHAEGKFLAFIDADVILLPNCLNALNECLQDPEVIGVMCKFLPLEGNGIENILYECNNVLMKISSKTGVPQLSYFACVSYRKGAFDKVSGFREDLNACEDYDLALRLSKYGKIIFTDKTTIYASPRRLREWTYPRYIGRYLKYLFQYHASGRIHGHYDVIR